MSSRQEPASAGQDVFRIGRGLVIGRARVDDIVGFLVFAAAYYLAYRYGTFFTHAAQRSGAPLWFPSSILLCALLASRMSNWWIFSLVALPIRLFASAGGDAPTWYVVGAYAFDALNSLAAAFALRRFLRDPLHIETLQEFGVYCLIAVLLVPGIAALGGAALRVPLGGDYWNAWQQWFLGDALTQFVVTPAILTLISGGRSSVRALSTKRRIEAAVALSGLILAAYIAGYMSAKPVMLTQPAFYAPILFVFWAAIRFGMFGASVAIAVWAFIFAAAAAAGKGPFTGQSPAETALSLQAFLLPRALTIYLVGLVVEQLTRAQKFLRESEQRFRDMANAAPVLIWMSGRDKLCNFFNQGWLEFTGRPMEAELGPGWAEGVHPQDVQHCLETHYSAFDARRPFEVEYRLRRHDGEYRWVLDRGVPRYALDGEFIGYIGSVIDITDRRNMEQLNSSMAHVQRLAAIGELSAAITHELGQPLSAILLNMGAARKLLELPNPPLAEIREIVSEVDQSLSRANTFIRTTRSFLGKQEMQMAAVDIYSMVFDLLVLVANEAVQRGVHVRTDLPPGLPPLLGDRTQLQQVLLNLIINGMDAMTKSPAGSRDLMLRCRLNEGRVEFTVADRGCGISAEKMAGLFDPFFTTKENGFGLGLSIARSIVEAHKGRIWAENNPQGGATFHFTVRIAESRTSEIIRGVA